MRILFDQGVLKPLQAQLHLHTVTRSFALGWDMKKNGALLTLAEDAGFDMLVTTDQNMRYQQSLSRRCLAIFVLGRGNWPEIQPYVAEVVSTINAIKGPGIYYFPIPPSP